MLLGIGACLPIIESLPSHENNIWVMDQACLVKMAGYILAKFFFFACFWTEAKSRLENTTKKLGQ